MTAGEYAKLNAKIATLKEIALDYIREQIFDLGCYCNEHPLNKGAYNIYLFLCKLCFK